MQVELCLKNKKYTFGCLSGGSKGIPNVFKINDDWLVCISGKCYDLDVSLSFYKFTGVITYDCGGADYYINGKHHKYKSINGEQIFF